MNKRKLSLLGLGLSLACALAPRIASANVLNFAPGSNGITCSAINYIYYDFKGETVTATVSVDGSVVKTDTFSLTSPDSTTQLTYSEPLNLGLTGTHTISVHDAWAGRTLDGSAQVNCGAPVVLDYFGRAYGVFATTTLLNLQTVLLNAINDTGGVNGTNPQDVKSNVVSTTGIVTASVLTGEVKTGSGKVVTTETIASASVGLPGLPVVVATGGGPGLVAVSSNATTMCGVSPGTTSSTANSSIVSLTVGGIKVVGPGGLITGAIKPNTTITILGIQLILNEQVPIVIQGKTVGVAVNAVRIIANPAGANLTTISVAVGHSESFITGC